MNISSHNQTNLEKTQCDTLQEKKDSDKIPENTFGKINAYDYNNFYFNRCLGIFILFI